MSCFRAMNMAVSSLNFRCMNLYSWSCPFSCLLFRKRFTDGALNFSVSMITMALPLGIFFRSFSMIGAIFRLCVFILFLPLSFLLSVCVFGLAKICGVLRRV